MNTPAQREPLQIVSLESTLWQRVHQELEQSICGLNMLQLLSPTMLILHDLLDVGVKAMHRGLFFRLAQDDFGIFADSGLQHVETLFAAEISEHGSQNIARYCQQQGQHVTLSFPEKENAIFQLELPVAFDLSQCSTTRLMEALGFRLEQQGGETPGAGMQLTLYRKPGSAAQLNLGSLLDDSASMGSVESIYHQLGYGIVRFSGVGELLAMSATLLDNIKLPLQDGSINSFSSAIPFSFYNDIIWGMALGENGGKFENYRVRMRSFSSESKTVLFNISGFRDESGIIHSLWQVVSFAEGNSSLGEGSMQSEARIHKITRNYVPQLVEEKAREAVRMGKESLTNEECTVAVLFCDIVGFTSFVESHASSESIITTLNTLLRRVSVSVKRFNGSIDKFMGDSIMAIFRNPADAVRAAQDMQSHSEDINILRARAGQEMLKLRIGIHWGEVVIGNVGTPERLDWTAIGDVVNTASRIEKNCNPGAILVSQTVRDAIPSGQHPDIHFGDIFAISVKGKKEALPVCHVRQPESSS